MTRRFCSMDTCDRALTAEEQRQGRAFCAPCWSATKGGALVLALAEVALALTAYVAWWIHTS